MSTYSAATLSIAKFARTNTHASSAQMMAMGKTLTAGIVDTMVIIAARSSQTYYSDHAAVIGEECKYFIEYNMHFDAACAACAIVEWTDGDRTL